MELFSQRAEKEAKAHTQQPDDKLLSLLWLSRLARWAAAVRRQEVEKFNTFCTAYPPCSQEQAISAAEG